MNCNAITNIIVRNAIINAINNGRCRNICNAIRDENGKRVKRGDKIESIFDEREYVVTAVGSDYIDARPVKGGAECEFHDGEFTVCNAVCNAEMIKVRGNMPAYVGDKVKVQGDAGVIEAITSRGQVEVRLTSGEQRGRILVAAPGEVAITNTSWELHVA